MDRWSHQDSTGLPHSGSNFRGTAQHRQQNKLQEKATELALVELALAELALAELALAELALAELALVLVELALEELVVAMEALGQYYTRLELHCHHLHLKKLRHVR